MREDMASMFLCVKGNIDIAVHNAGVISISPAEEMEEAAWDHVGGVNAKGVFLCCKAVIPWMKNQGGGKIVFESLWISKRCIERFFFRLLT